jgi:carbon monoxide dehydrogenase subunit G
MSHYYAEASEIIDAPPEKVYAVISDYHEGHPSILPSRYFTEMTVDEGGQGAGTFATIRMNVFGTKVLYHMSVTEPEPGRVLVEEDKSAGVTTTFTLDPFNGGGQTRVTISTKAKTSPGLRGMIEKLANPPILRKIYREELQQLAEVVQRKNGPILEIE